VGFLPKGPYNTAVVDPWGFGLNILIHRLAKLDAIWPKKFSLAFLFGLPDDHGTDLDRLQSFKRVQLVYYADPAGFLYPRLSLDRESFRVESDCGTLIKCFAFGLFGSMKFGSRNVHVKRLSATLTIPSVVVIVMIRDIDWELGRASTSEIVKPGGH